MVGRTQYILLTNTPSLYTVVMPGKGITNAARFIDRAAEHLEEIIYGDLFESIYRNSIAPELSQVKYSKTLNRSVTGSMSDLMWLSQSTMAQEEIPLSELCRFLNNTPMSYLAHGKPRKAFDMLSTGR